MRFGFISTLSVFTLLAQSLGASVSCCGWSAHPDCNDHPSHCPCEWDVPYREYGEWLPETPPLFRPFAADPRQVTYSVAWRFNDTAITKNAIPVSFGDICVLYEWNNVDFGWVSGPMQLGVEGALWAIFEPLNESSPLVDADYYVGFPLTLRDGPWSYRLRGYHISTHIGDEFLLNHPGFDRRNPSAEFLDFSVSYEFTDEIRLYGLGGVILHQDPSFPLKRWFVQGGSEIRLYRLGFVDYCQHLYGTPIFAMNFFYRPNFHGRVDATYILGYEFGKLSGLQRRLRAFVEYHDGYSVEGQFCKLRTTYLSLRLTYGF